MSEKKHDSVLVGWADEPRFTDSGELMDWTVRLKDHELKDILDQYVTSRNDKGHGGNVYITLFKSKAGKSHARVYNPNSEAAREKREEKNNQAATQEGSGLPF